MHVVEDFLIRFPSTVIVSLSLESLCNRSNKAKYLTTAPTALKLPVVASKMPPKAQHAAFTVGRKQGKVQYQLDLVRFADRVLLYMYSLLF